MHEAFWNGLFDVRWEEAPLGAEAIRLTVRLRERGYAGRTCRDYGHAVVHLGRFLREELGSDQVRDEEAVADFFGDHLPPLCRCYRRPVGRREEPARRGLGHLLVMLREEGAIPPVVADEPPCQELIEGYCRFLRRDRGLAETTVVNYRRHLRDFLISRGAAVSPAELAALSADDLLAFGRQRQQDHLDPVAGAGPVHRPARFAVGNDRRDPSQGVAGGLRDPGLEHPPRPLLPATSLLPFPGGPPPCHVRAR